MKFSYEFDAYVMESGLHRLTVSAHDVAEFYQMNEDRMDHLFHFDEVSVVESDACLYLNPANAALVREQLHNLPERMQPRIERWCNTIDKPKMGDMEKIIKRLGYKLVHTWYESHGNGGQAHYQSEMGGRVITLCFAPGGYLKSFYYDDNPRHDYLRAADIEQELKRAEEDGDYRYPEYRLLGEEKGSVCCTASWFDVLERGAREAFRVHRIAGHGSYASKLSIKDMPRCEDCKEHIPFKDIEQYQKEAGTGGTPRVCEDCAEAHSIDERMVRHAEG